MKKLFLAFTALALCLSATACMLDHVKGSGKITSENKNTGVFSNIRSSGSIDIVITQSDNHAATVETDDNLQQYVVIENEKGTLNIYFKKGIEVSPTKAIVHLSCSQLGNIASSGSGDITTKGNFKTNELTISHSGSGDFDLDITALKVGIKKSGSGDVELKGNVEEFSIASSGSGDTDASQLNCLNAIVRSSGSGDYVFKKGIKVSTSISGSGEVEYR